MQVRRDCNIGRIKNVGQVGCKEDKWGALYKYGGQREYRGLIS